ncbi:MAG: phenylalanine--tRNA ligase beta subunit-related protein [Peptostreptococcaceae bacterium]|nr:phenylalanine--tRNA ligase beta subunit-related protein [Peptostreptococcaceae bacterium]
MNRIEIQEQVFDKLPQYCLGIILIDDVDNSGSKPEISRRLKQEIRHFAEKYASVDLRELPAIKAYRTAFQLLGINPNKYPCSVEALAKRVQKNGSLPSINPIVDVGNAFSLKYLLPMGAHDITGVKNPMKIRFSTIHDHFLGIGENDPEKLEAGELIYVSGHTVRTRRWLWRQSEEGKITEKSRQIFFPIDGFADVNLKDVLEAQKEMELTLRSVFRRQVQTAFLSKKNPFFEF